MSEHDNPAVRRRRQRDRLLQRAKRQVPGAGVEFARDTVDVRRLKADVVVPQPGDELAWPVTSLSRSPQAFALASGSVICLALSILLFSCGSSTWVVLKFPVRTMFFPLNSRSMKLWAAKKSGAPAEARTDCHGSLGDLAELRQHCRGGHLTELQSEADLCDLAWNASAVPLAGDSLSAIVSRGGPRSGPSRSRPSSGTPSPARGFPSGSTRSRSLVPSRRPPPRSPRSRAGGSEWRCA